MSIEIVSELFDRLKRDIQATELEFLSTCFSNYNDYMKNYGSLQAKYRVLGMLQDMLKEQEDS